MSQKQQELWEKLDRENRERFERSQPLRDARAALEKQIGEKATDSLIDYLTELLRAAGIEVTERGY